MFAAALKTEEVVEPTFSYPTLLSRRLCYTLLLQSGSVSRYNCERSELLIWQVHQFELGCIKLHTPYRYKIHPELYSDWSMCTVFYTTNIFRVFEHRVESTVVFRSYFNTMARRTSNAGVEECKGYSPPNYHATSASSTPLPLGSWNLNTGTQLHVRTEKLKMPNG